MIGKRTGREHVTGACPLLDSPPYLGDFGHSISPPQKWSSNGHHTTKAQIYVWHTHNSAKPPGHKVGDNPQPLENPHNVRLGQIGGRHSSRGREPEYLEKRKSPCWMLSMMGVRNLHSDLFLMSNWRMKMALCVHPAFGTMYERPVNLSVRFWIAWAMGSCLGS